MQKRPLGFVVAGAGFIGRRHCEILHAHPDCRLLGIVEPQRSIQAELVKTYPVPVFSALSSALEAIPAAEVVTVATPNSLHAPLSIEALRAGRHVVVEKPMTHLRQAAQQLVESAQKHGRQVFVVKQNRYTPTAEWLKAVVSGGHLGRVLFVEINCFWNRDYRYYTQGGWKGTRAHDGGTLFTQFSHFIDILYWVFGDITHIQARIANLTHGDSIEIEDTGCAQFAFVEGGMGSINFSTSAWDRNLESSITVLGERGSLKISGQYMNEVTHCHIEGYQMPELPPANPPNNYGKYQGSAANHHFVFQNVVDTLRAGGKPHTNALEGLKVVDMIERIYAAAGR